MDRDLVKYFNRQIEHWSDAPLYAAMVDHIRRLGQHYHIPIRPDAIYFIANSMEDLVLDPVRQARARPIVAETQIRTAVLKDIEKIISRCHAVAQESERPEVTPNVVLIATASIYQDLEVNAYNIWGR